MEVNALGINLRMWGFGKETPSTRTLIDNQADKDELAKFRTYKLCLLAAMQRERWRDEQLTEKQGIKRKRETEGIERYRVYGTREGTVGDEQAIGLRGPECTAGAKTC